MVIYIALAGFGGALVSGLLGYLKVHSNFSFHKLLPTILRAFISGGVLAIGVNSLYYGVENFWMTMICAFLVGAGVDVVGHRVAGAIKS